MKKLGLAVALAVSMSTAWARDVSQLSDPIVAYAGVIGKNADALELTPEQRQKHQDWVATAQPKRMALEDRVIAARTELRDMINSGAPKAKRMKLARQIGTMESQLLMLRSNCTDYWRRELTSAQFEKLLSLSQIKPSK